jgi:hypothetical protein
MTALSTVGEVVRTAVMTPVMAARRASAGPVLVRLIAVLAGIGAATLAAPIELLTGRLPAFVLVVGASTVAVGLAPRSRWVGTFLLGVVALWLITTIAYETDGSLLRIAGLAACIYLTHAAAALAAVLPYDAVVPGRVLRRWAGRVATVLVAGVGVAVGGVAAIRILPSVPSEVGPIVGSIVAAAIAGVLVWQVRQRFGR